MGCGSGEDRCSPAWLAVALPAARCPGSAKPENLEVQRLANKVSWLLQGYSLDTVWSLPWLGILRQEASDGQPPAAVTVVLSLVWLS